MHGQLQNSPEIPSKPEAVCGAALGTALVVLSCLRRV